MFPRQIRITKVGLWFSLLMLVIGLAAANTGNNALYMVVASMIGLGAVSWVLALVNAGPLEIQLQPPAEAHANQPFRLGCTVANTSPLLSRWLLQVDLGEGTPLAIGYLGRRGAQGAGAWRGEQEILCSRRGRFQLVSVRISSLFPFGLFRRAVTVPVELDLIIYPELFEAARLELDDEAKWGSEPSRRAGWGHDLRSLRGYREGDDPRGIHWKRSASTGRLVFKEREAEESRRLTIVVDNGAEAVGGVEAGRFERLISEAATAAVDFLRRGYEVELVTRDEHLPFGSGPRHRSSLLTVLALLEPVEPVAQPLHGSRHAPELRFALERAAVRADESTARPLGAVS